MPSYSPLDVHATIVGPGGVINLGIGSGLAKDGISYSKAEATNVMEVGLDGSVCHNKSESTAGTITFTFLGISDANLLIQALYNFQEKLPGSVNHGKNTITLHLSSTGKTIIGTECAFQNESSGGFKDQIENTTWTFDCGHLVII